MKKLIILISTILLGMTIVFAEPKSSGITDSDVKSFVKNYSKIMNEIDALPDNPSALKTADSILEKYGISGPNRIEKMQSITICSVPVMMEYEMSKDPEAAKMMKAMGIDPAAQFKKNINSKDYSVVLANSKLLSKIADEIEERENSSKKSSIDKRRQNLSEFERHDMKNFGLGDSDDDIETYDQFKRMGLGGNEAFYNEEKAASERARNEEASAKAEYDKNIKYGKSLKKKILSSRKDTGFLYKELDSKRASKYKLIETITEAKLSKFSDANYLIVNYDSDYYSGTIKFSIENSLMVFVDFTDFNDRSSAYPETKEIDSFELSATKVEKYSTGDGYSDGELVVYTKEAGPIHMWYKDDKAVLRCGGLGTIKGEHSVPAP